MKLTRRQIVLGGLGLMALGGCQTQSSVSSRPAPLWPDDVHRPVPSGQPLVVRPAPPHRAPTPPTPRPPGATRVGPIRAIPRSSWAKASPIGSRLNPMGSISRITVHHEGWTPVWFSDAGSTAERLEAIRKSHLQRLRAGDIGYHFVIDRAGRIWQGRDLKYQGAHVKDHNANNVGVMVLGNFDVQHPSSAQYTTLRSTLLSLMHTYRVPVRRVYTHQELNSTSCPGKVMQAHMMGLRRTGLG